MSERGFFTYMLECADGTFYAGWTTDPQKRLDTHNTGKGAKYTRSRLPVILRALWSFDTRSEAQRHELHLKSLSRQQKSRLIQEATSQLPE